VAGKDAHISFNFFTYVYICAKPLNSGSYHYRGLQAQKPVKMPNPLCIRKGGYYLLSETADIAKELRILIM
jgi:hypothetical protein